MRPSTPALVFSLLLAACGNAHAAPGDAGVQDANRLDAAVDAVFTSCSANSDCVIVANSCCGPCGAPELPSVVAVNGASQSAYHELVCAAEPPQMCPLCPTRLNSNLVAVCDAGSCVARDIRSQPYTACATNEDCRARSAACCECENAVFGPYVAVNTSTDSLLAYEAVVCNASTACSSVMACQAYPSGTPAAFCDAETLHCMLPPDA